MVIDWSTTIGQPKNDEKTLLIFCGKNQQNVENNNT